MSEIHDPIGVSSYLWISGSGWDHENRLEAARPTSVCPPGGA